MGPRKITRVVQRTIPYLLILLAFALRLYRIDYQSIWWDEGFSVHLARLSVPEAMSLTARDIHPPLYYILLHYWVALAGDTEFSLRFLSLVFNVLLVAGAYALARRFFGDRTALIASTLTTIAPLQVIYSQEARMYTLLTLEYLAILYVFYLLIVERQRLSWREWTLLIMMETGSLYTHYLGLLIIGGVSLLAVAYLALGQRWRDLKVWVGAQGLVLALYLPWVWIAGEQLTAYIPKWAEPADIVDFTRVVWHFFIVGTTQVIDTHTVAPRASAVLGLCFLVTLPLALVADRRRARAIPMLFHFLLPAAVIFAMQQIRPGFHPRYLMAFHPALLLLLGRAIAILVTQGPFALKPLGVALGLTLLSVSTIGLRLYYFDKLYHKDDVRSMTRYLEERADERDVIISDYGDLPAFRYYYHGRSAAWFLDMEGPDRPLMAELQGATQGKQRAFFVKWAKGETDRRHIIPFCLELGGRRTDRKDLLGLSVLGYQLVHPFQVPELEPLFADFGLLQLTGAFFEEDLPADEAIPLALRWRLAQRVDRTYRATVRLRDEQGHLISSADRSLLNEGGWRTRKWPVGKEVTNFYTLPIPPGTPPLSYTISVGVYDKDSMRPLDLLSDARTPLGKRFILGSVKLTKPRRFSLDSAYRRSKRLAWASAGVTLAKGLSLEDFSIGRSSVRPGDRISVALRWRATEDDLPEYTPQLRLTQGKRIIALGQSALENGRYPTNAWSRGEVVLDWWDLVVSPEAEGGKGILELTVDGSTWTPLTELKVMHIERLFEVPSIGYALQARFGDLVELLGYDLDRSEATKDQDVGLTLYWRAQNPKPLDTSYKVFTHLLDQEGKLIGQHDSPPALGERLTTSWVEGEIIIDYHPMRFKDGDFAGQATIEIGLYDEVTGRRVRLSDGAKRIILPSRVRVKSE